MKQYLKNYLSEILIRESYSPSDANIIELLVESPVVSETEKSWTHWTDITRVVRVGDRFIRYDWARGHGDYSATDGGWSFDWNAVVEVRPYEEIVVKYAEVE